MVDKLERFLNYIRFDTKSNGENSSCPSTPGQLELGKELVKELLELGLENAQQDEHGYVYATLPGNVTGVPTIGLIAHMDTAPDLDGKCVSPQIIEEYKGGDIRLNDRYSICEKEFPFLKDLVGHKLITTDGTTLLGADDKAGITIIMSVLEYFTQHPEVQRGTIQVGFTPDEEIGRGAALFDVERFNADFAYTLDGGPQGELEFENFNAASAKIHIQGKNVHPGSAKNIMINSLRIAGEIDALLPVNEKPEYTEGYEGFFLLDSIEGTVESTEMSYIIRDHSMDKFKSKKQLLEDIVAWMNKKYGPLVTLEMSDSYYNMREKIEPHMEIVDLAKRAMEEVGVVPDTSPIRGGTDGAQLSFKGLLTPNLFTGGFNYHGRYELLSVNMMEKAIETVIRIIENNVK